MTVEIVIDYETRSRVSLRHCNVYKYARHPSTEVLCASWAFPWGPVEIWRQGEPFPFSDIWPDVHILAAGAEFEYEIWCNVCTRPDYGWPVLPAERISCLQARTSYAGLPRKLAAVGDTLGLGDKAKDDDGHRNMLRLCRPQRATGCGTPKLGLGAVFTGGDFDRAPSKHERNERYCQRDAVAERFISRLVPELPTDERRLWVAHREINERGVPIDVPMCRAAHQICEWEKEKLCEKLRDVTSTDMKSPDCVVAFKEWAKNAGYRLPNLESETVQCMLDGQMGEVPEAVRKALEIRTLYKSKAITKYPAMLAHELNGRCQGGHVFYKAGPGRFAGQGVNFLNLFRLNEDRVDEFTKLADRLHAANDVELGDLHAELLHMGDGNVIGKLGAMVRMAVCAAPGKKLVVSDYSSIEMRVLHWLAEDHATLKQISDFDNGIGEEPYRLAAASIYEKKVSEVTKAERQTGKVQILGCGYLSGAQTFSAFCGNYGIDMPIDKAQELVQHYRRSHPKVVGFWYHTGKSVTRTVKDRKPRTVGHFDIYMTGYTLNVRLPSGRELKYYNPKVVKGDFGDELEAIDQRSGRRRIVGLPTIIENCIAEGTPVLTDNGWKPIELVSESDKVWDGLEWCYHSGVVCSGEQTTINLCGVHMTPDHKVLVNGEWETASAVQAIRSLKDSDLLGVAINDRQVPASLASSMEKLRGAWHSSLQTLAQFREIPKRHGAIICHGVMLGPDQQCRELPTLELPLDELQNTSSQQAGKCHSSYPVGGNDAARSVGKIRHRETNVTVPSQTGVAASSPVHTAGCTKRVYDIKNCGTRNRFVVRGTQERCLIVHNCDQAISRDLLADALLKCHDERLPVVLHVYDSIVLESPENDADRHYQQLVDVMNDAPAWARGLPVANKGGVAKRFTE